MVGSSQGLLGTAFPLSLIHSSFKKGSFKKVLNDEQTKCLLLFKQDLCLFLVMELLVEQIYQGLVLHREMAPDEGAIHLEQQAALNAAAN